MSIQRADSGSRSMSIVSTSSTKGRYVLSHSTARSRKADDEQRAVVTGRNDQGGVLDHVEINDPPLSIVHLLDAYLSRRVLLSWLLRPTESVTSNIWTELRHGGRGG